ncbi:TetR/AcrR family transcriptional regulator [Actinocorallia populi]|uniref:TetR/AcrR family transcriptional regulator n=1 Tax=Actinocorallia populi TaxID=2079200 RepID=UPI000D08FD5C|nr:TetR/AcrR family transcriptional regulator [Actinocorallia populi]
MPRIVDHEARRRELTEALWRVVSRDGVEAVSVRNVAAEAGCSPGALRHYFPDQKDLITSAMSLVSERVTARIRALRPSGSTLENAQAHCEQLIPLDAERRFEASVWFGFVNRARLDPELEELTNGVHRDLRAFLAGLVRAMGLDESETGGLHALIDGLSMHLLLYPGQVGPREVRERLRAYLERLLRDAP